MVLIIEADRQVSHGRLVDVWSAAQAAGVQSISLATGLRGEVLINESESKKCALILFGQLSCFGFFEFVAVNAFIGIGALVREALQTVWIDSGSDQKLDYDVREVQSPLLFLFLQAGYSAEMDNSMTRTELRFAKTVQREYFGDGLCSRTGKSISCIG